jgi:hypothetical protein
VRAGQPDSDGAANDGDIRQGIAKIVNEDTAEIEVVAPAHQREGDAAVHSERGNRSPNHPAFDDAHRRAKALDGFISEPERKDDQDDGVGEGSESSGTVVAVSFLAVRGALRPVHGQPGNAESGHVGKIVDGIVQERDGAAEETANDLRGNEQQGGQHGPAEHRGS